jgi:hypothetical protein
MNGYFTIYNLYYTQIKLQKISFVNAILGTHLTFLWFCVHVLHSYYILHLKIITALMRKQCKSISNTRRMGCTLREKHR